MIVAQVLLEMTMTVDGFVRAPGASREHPLGVGGERVHDWILGLDGLLTGETRLVGAPVGGARPGGAGGPEQIDRMIAARIFSHTGAFVMGRRTFDVGEDLWGESMVFAQRPCFVVTHRPHDPIIRGRSRFEFVTNGVGEAVRRATLVSRAAPVTILGSAAIAREALLDELVDELRMHLVPVLLGAGERLFPEVQARPVELELLRVERGARATHLRYRVIRHDAHRPGLRASAQS